MSTILTATDIVVRYNEQVVLDRATLSRVLAENSQNVSQAARQLGISRQALYRRMEKLGIKESPAR